MKQIYYAHSVNSLNTKTNISKISTIYPDTKIIDPVIDIIMNDEDRKKLSSSYPYYIEMMEKHFFPVIKQSDMLIYEQLNINKHTDGVNREIEYAKSINKPTMSLEGLILRNSNHYNKYERIQFYRDHPEYKKTMLDFMKVEEGMRCLAIRPDPLISPNIRYVYKDRSKSGYALRTLTEENFEEVISYGRTIEYLTYIFDEDIQNCRSITDISNHIIGLTPVIDLDAPDLYPNDASKGRYDITLPENKQYLEHMKRFYYKMVEELTEQDEVIQKLIFSGNGYQLILKDYYPEYSHDLEDINQFRDKILDTIDDVSQMTDYEFVHSKKYSWNNNMKIPYTFHFNFPNRLTREIHLDSGW